MKVEPGPFDGVLYITPDVYDDARGSFFEAWSAERYREAGITDAFVQDNVSRSSRGVLRGLHIQRNPHAQGKLITIPFGSIYDVIVDMRPSSKSFGEWAGYELSEENRRQAWIPPGFAHGFQVTSAEALVSYKCTSYYVSGHELSIAWNDASLGIAWPVAEPILSKRDAAGVWLATAERWVKSEGGLTP